MCSEEGQTDRLTSSWTLSPVTTTDCWPSQLLGIRQLTSSLQCCKCIYSSAEEGMRWLLDRSRKTNFGCRLLPGGVLVVDWGFRWLHKRSNTCYPVFFIFFFYSSRTVEPFREGWRMKPRQKLMQTEVLLTKYEPAWQYSLSQCTVRISILVICWGNSCLVHYKIVYCLVLCLSSAFFSIQWTRKIMSGLGGWPTYTHSPSWSAAL